MGLNLRPEPYLVGGGTAVPPPTEVPENTSLPTATGFATSGQEISGSNGGWDQPPILSYTYQHQISDTGVGAGTDIVGATAANYTLISGQVGKYFRRGVKAANAIGPAAAFAYSAYIGPIVSAPSITLVPDTTGTEGAAYSAGVPSKSGGHGAGLFVLTGTIGASGLSFNTATGELSAATLGVAATYGPYSIQWFDDDGIGSNVIGPFDVESQASGGGAPVEVTPPSISYSSTDIGQVWTGVAGTYTPTPDNIARQWKRDGSIIVGETGTTYTLTVADTSTPRPTITYCEVPSLGGVDGLESVSAGVQPFHPLQLSPHFFFDAENSANITQSGGVVSAWTSSAADAITLSQGTLGFRPGYNATGLNGRPCITGDGTDDYLRNAALGGVWPVGSVGSELWGTVNQPTPAGTSGQRWLFGYGNFGGGTTRARHIYRQNITSVNRFLLGVGTSATDSGSTNTSVDFSGIHVVRGIVGTTACQADVDNVAGPSVAAVPNTLAATATMFAKPTDTPGGFTAASIACVGSYPITITSDDVTSLYRWHGARGGLSLP